MWKYKLVLINILNIIPLAVSLPNKTKQNELADALSDIFRKRKECEKSLMSDYTTTAYKLWTELIKEKESELCHNYIGTNLSQIHRSVISTHTRIVDIYFKEIKERNEKEFDSVLVTILQCGVSPLFHRRRHINFMRSSTTDCLYVVNQLSQSVDKFYIAGEVCLSGRYDLKHICLADVYELNRERKRRNYQRRNDSNDERRQYEMNHLKDYTLKPEKHKQWPELEGEDLNKFCHILVGHFSPRDIFLRVGKVHTVLIHYMEIRDTEHEVPPTMDVGALVCEIPEKKRNDNYNFIRAVTPNCVYMVKRMNPKRVRPTCYIAKQYCGAEILQYDRTTTDFQLYENKDTDFPYGTEFANSLDENIYYEETEILSYDQYQNEMDSRVDTGEVTKQAVVSHIDPDIVPLGNYTSVYMFEQNEVINGSFRQKKRAMYERNHMKEYIKSPDNYERWPELNKESEMEICSKYVDVLFIDKPRSVISTHTRNVWLQYQLIKENDMEVQSARIILVLLCKIFPTLGKRKFMYFVKSPTPNCLYLSNPLKRNPHILYIIEEVCLNEDWTLPNDIFQRKLNYSRQHRRWNDDEPSERREYESNHFNDHKLKTIEYQKWPVTKEKDMEIHCRILLNQLFPKNKYTEIKIEHISIELKYIEIKDEENNEFATLKLGALGCRMPQKKQKKYYVFVRSQKENCVYLIKKITLNGSYYYISKLICEDQVLHVKGKRKECLNLSVDHHINSLFDEKSNSDDEIFMELDDIEEL